MFQKTVISPLSISNDEFSNKNENHSHHKNEKKSVLKEVLYNSLAQAIIKSFETSHLILKLFLITFVIITSGFASYFVIGSLMTYLSFGVTTTSRTTERPTLFPKVTFCNVNQLTTEYAFKLYKKGIKEFSNFSNEEKKKLGHDLNDILVECSFSNMLILNVIQLISFGHLTPCTAINLRLIRVLTRMVQELN